MLSPTLYNVYTSNLSKCIRKNVMMLQYADDIVLYTICNKTQEGVNCMQIALRESFIIRQEANRHRLRYRTI